MQLNAVVTLVLAVVVLREPCTILQVAGAILMVAGSLVTQRASQPRPQASRQLAASPRIAAGFFFASIAALMYGTIARSSFARRSTMLGPLGGWPEARSPTRQRPWPSLSGCFIPSLRRNVMQVSGENARWFVYSGVFVAAAQGFLYSALAVAPIMLVVAPLATFFGVSLPVRATLNPHHELFGAMVVFGSIVSIVGACAVSIDTDLILRTLALPQALAGILGTKF